MTWKSVFTTVLIILTQLVLAQGKIIDSYTKYFELPRELIYIQTNKTDYIQGEDIWFKGYIYDQLNEVPSRRSSNIEIGIYDSLGRQLQKKLHLAYEGTVRGNIEIDSLPQGNYILKASTNWMRNFLENQAYSTSFRITDSQENSNSTVKETSYKYDLQILPESGNLLLGMINTIGIKLINEYEKGIAGASGQIFDNQGNEITRFTTNNFGLSSCKFLYDSQKSYTAKVTLNDKTVVTSPIPRAYKSGVTINVVNGFKDKILIALNKSNSTNENQYDLIIHQNGKIKNIDIDFNEEEHLSLTFNRGDLFAGLNTITLFNKNQQPLAERLVFNNYFKINQKITLEAVKRSSDSILLSAYTSTKDSIYYNLSISVLPEDSEAYYKNDNIVSTFKLSSHIKGYIENPSYYFISSNRRKKFDLDLLLMTQGWSKYKWENIFNKIPRANYEFENGLKLTGKLNAKIEKDWQKSLFLFAFKNGESKVLYLDDDGAFELENLFPTIGENLQLAFLNDKAKKPTLYTSLHFKKNNDVISKRALSIIAAQFNKFPKQEEVNLDGFITGNTIELEEVIVKKIVKKRFTGNNFSKNGQNVEINEDNYSRYADLLNFIERNGNGGFRVFKDITGSVAIVSSRSNGIRGPEPVLVFLDDSPLSDLSILANFPLQNVQNVFFDKSGLGYGIRAAGGVIKIYSRKTSLRSVKTKSPIYSKVLKKGFEPIKEYYSPKYVSYNIMAFKKYGVVHWLSDIYISNNQPTLFKIPDTKQKKIKCYIEGMDSEGRLISDFIMLNIPD